MSHSYYKKRDKEIKENSLILEIDEIETSKESMIPFVLKEKKALENLRKDTVSG